MEHHQRCRVARERCGRGLRWRTRYRDGEGRQRSRPFAIKGEAVRFLALVQADLLRGSYLDPGRSRTALSVYARQWLESLSIRPTTRLVYDSHLRTWILPALGARPLISITPTEVRLLVRQLREQLAPSTALHVHGLLSSMLRAAVEDGYLIRNPTARTAPPRPRQPALRPLTVEQVQALLDAVPDRYRVAVLLGAGCGLRIGEVLGLTVDVIDLDARELTVAWQLQALPGQPPTLRPPKSDSSLRTVPLPDTVAAAIGEPAPLAHHRRGTGPADPDGDRPAGVATQLPQQHLAADRHRGRAPGRAIHQLRHFYASALIHAGESIKTVQAALGHASAVETLQIYVRLWPANQVRIRTAIDTLNLHSTPRASDPSSR